MPRKRKSTVDIMSNLELMSRDMSLPITVRAEAAKEFVRLKAKEQPAPAPPAPVSVPLVADFSTLVAALEQKRKRNRDEASREPRVRIATVRTRAKVSWP